jgi:hypothetical protein
MDDQGEKGRRGKGEKERRGERERRREGEKHMRGGGGGREGGRKSTYGIYGRPCCGASESPSVE